jgi:hypothetical protein
MADKRRAPRITGKQQAKALIGGRTEVGCTIRDMSALGARLRFPRPTFLPRKFRLAFDDQEQTVTVIWQAGLLAGVRFETPVRGLPRPERRRSWFGLRG